MASCERLKEKGKHNMAIIGAAMRKLLNIIFDIFKFKKKLLIKILSRSIWLEGR